MVSVAFHLRSPFEVACRVHRSRRTGFYALGCPHCGVTFCDRFLVTLWGPCRPTRRADKNRGPRVSPHVAVAAGSDHPDRDGHRSELRPGSSASGRRATDVRTPQKKGRRVMAVKRASNALQRDVAALIQHNADLEDLARTAADLRHKVDKIKAALENQPRTRNVDRKRARKGTAH